MVIKKIPFILLVSALTVLFFLSLPVSAAQEPLSITVSGNNRTLCDRKETASTVVEQVTVTGESEMETLYLLFYTEPCDFVLSSGSRSCGVDGKYLRQTVDLTELFGCPVSEVTLSFSAPTRLTELYAFQGELPSWVQIWSDPCEKADLCLMTTHADDEQLFFAGILPYYAGEKGLAVQVIYFTDHVNEPGRRHELLSGLWTVGVRAYPVISPFPDLYSTSEKQAENQFSSRGFSRSDVISFQVEMLRRFRPLVVVGHDPEGEYGHGQHRLNSSTLREAVALSADEAAFPASAEKYGTWDVPKTYLHLYPENPIEMNWDVPLAAFDGKTAFQVSQEGFACHKSQQYTWFRTWLRGNSGEIKNASQIRTYSPCQYGLFRSTVGADEAKNDFFEHLKSYEEQRLEAEQKAREEKTELLFSTLAERTQSGRREAEEAHAALKLAESDRLARQRERILAISITSAAVIALIALISLWLIRQRKK